MPSLKLNLHSKKGTRIGRGREREREWVVEKGADRGRRSNRLEICREDHWIFL